MDQLMGKYPDRVPVVFESKIGGDAKKVLKYMVPRDKTIGQMMVKLRKHVQMNSKQAVYLFVNNTLPPNTSTVGQVWEQHKNEKNVLHIVYSLENTFG